MKIPISKIKEIRESLDTDHLVILTIDNDGAQNVATHGKSRFNAATAADLGNKLKKLLKWPENLCKDYPLPRICKNCAYFKVDWGIHCFNGWTGDGKSGNCLAEPTRVKVGADETCRHFEPNC